VPEKPTDPELMRQLDDAKESGEPVRAVVKMRRRPGKAPVPQDVEEQVNNAVERAARASGEQPKDVHVMGRLSVAYVEGSESFLRELVNQPEVDAAVANEPASRHREDRGPDQT
jgi:hypothetical protein